MYICSEASCFLIWTLVFFWPLIKLLVTSSLKARRVVVIVVWLHFFPFRMCNSEIRIFFVKHQAILLVEMFSFVIVSFAVSRQIFPEWDSGNVFSHRLVFLFSGSTTSFPFGFAQQMQLHPRQEVLFTIHEHFLVLQLLSFIASVISLFFILNPHRQVVVGVSPFIS